MKIKSGIQKLLSNKFVLYAVVLIFFVNVISLITYNNTLGLLFIIIIAGFFYFIQKIKNMILVLGGTLILYYILSSINFAFFSLGKKEGMDNNEDDKKEVKKDENSEDKKEEDHKKTIDKINKNSATSSQGLVMTPLQENTDTTVNTSESNVTTDESFEVGRTKKNSNGYNIDYASTVEDAYDELNKILGSDGIKRLTNDTQKLMKQQLQLAESMKSMQPLISGMAPLMEQAKGLLGNIGGDGNLNNLMNIAEKFSGNKK